MHIKNQAKQKSALTIELGGFDYMDLLYPFCSKYHQIFSPPCSLLLNNKIAREIIIMRTEFKMDQKKIKIKMDEEHLGLPACKGGISSSGSGT